MYNQADETEDFTAEQLKMKWDEFVAKLKKQHNLKSTLANVPEIKKDYSLVLDIENSIQNDLINTIKPELVSWLRKELKNSKIQLTTVITEKVKNKIIYTDEERFEEMVKKNPQLKVLKQKFGLDFGQ